MWSGRSPPSFSSSTGCAEDAWRGDPGPPTPLMHSPSVLFVSPTAERTGPTTSLGFLLDGLAGRIRPTVLTSGEGAFHGVLGAKEIPLWSVPSLKRREIPGLVARLRQESYDLVYANETNRATRNACIAAALAGIPFVCHVRSMGWSHGWWDIGHLSGARRVISVSRACALSVARFVRADRLRVVYNGVPLPPPASREDRALARARLRTSLGLAPDKRIIVSVGHLTPRKGQHLALAAFRRLRASGIDAHLLIVGALDRDAEYVSQVQAAAGTSPLEGAVSILGFRTDVSSLLLGADVLLHAALADPHPRAVLEGMAAALPVVAFAVDGVSETVRTDESGVLAAAGDAEELGRALVRILASPDGGARMGVKGRELAENEFSVDRTTTGVGAVLDELLATAVAPRVGVG